MNQENIKNLKLFSGCVLLPLMLIFSEAQSAHAQSVSHNDGESEIRLFSTFNFEPPSDGQPQGETDDGGVR